MATIIGDLAVRIGADTSGLTKGLSSARKQIRQLGKEARQGTTDLAKYGAAAAAAGAAIAAGLVANSITATREMSNLAKLANASVDTFQKMAFGAKTVGIEQDKLADILKDTSDRVGDFLATGGGPMADFFENIAPKIGVTAQQFRNLSGPQALQLYADSLEKANLSQSELTFYMEAIASDATALLPLLRDGGAAMAEQAAQAERLGIVLSNVDTAKIEQASVAMTQVQDVLGGFVDQYTAQLSPVLTALANQFLGVAEEAGGVDDVATDAFNMTIDAAGFLLDAIEGVKRTFEVAGKGIALFALGGEEVLLSVAETILNGPVRAANELIEVFNKLPGVNIEPVGLSALGGKVQEQLADVRAAIEFAQEDIHATLMRPLPSSQFEKFVADAQEAGERAAVEMAKIQEAMVGGVGTGGPGKTEQDQTAELQSKLAKIQEANMTELELLRAKLAEENAIVNEAREQKLIGEQEWQATLLGNLERFESEQTEIERKESEKRRKLAEAEQRAKLDGFASMFGDLSTLMNTESRKMFEIGKAAALAQAIVDGYAAITGAYKVGASIGGPALGAAFGAAAAAATYTQIQAIRNASFGSGGSGAGAAATGSVTGGVNAQGQAVTGQTEQRQTLTLQGIDPNQLFTGRQLIELINEARRNGAVLDTE